MIKKRNIIYYGDRDRLTNNRDKINIYEKKRETDLNYKLNVDIRNRTHHALKAQNVGKSKKISIYLLVLFDCFKKWIIHQLFGEMSIDNYGSVWCIGQCLPKASFNVLNENELKKCFWMDKPKDYVYRKQLYKRAKIEYRLYLMQEIKAHQLISSSNDRRVT